MFWRWVDSGWLPGWFQLGACGDLFAGLLGVSGSIGAPPGGAWVQQDTDGTELRRVELAPGQLADLGTICCWLHCSGDDGRSISGFGDAAQAAMVGDLSLRVEGGLAAMPTPATLALALTALVAAGAVRGTRRHPAR